MLDTPSKFSAEYQRLLTGNESLASVKRAIKLVWDILGVRAKPMTEDIRFEPLTAADVTLAKQIEQIWASEGSRDLRSRSEGPNVQFTSKEQQRLRMLAEDSAVALGTASALGRISEKLLGDSNYSLLFDSCLLLAHHAYFALLPQLDEANLRVEIESFLMNFRRFADSLTRASDRFTLLALYCEATGDLKNADDHHRAALMATPADDHEFMTVLQTCWSSLIDRGLSSEALELLLESYPRVTRGDLDEVSELIRQTFQHSNTSANGHSRRVGKHATKHRKER